MLSSASRRTDRATAATLALLLQAAFIAAFIHAFTTEAPPRQLEHELTFFLPRLLPKPAPIVSGPRPSSAPLTVPVITPPIVFYRPAPSVTTVPLANIQNFGRALSGCAPEKWASLTPQQRALCPPPGQGMAIQNAPSLYGLPSQVKDNSHWANALAHERSPLQLPGAAPDASPGMVELNVLTVHGDGTVSGLLPAITSGTITNTENWPTYIDPNQFMRQAPLKGGKATDQSSGTDSK